MSSPHLPFSLPPNTAHATTLLDSAAAATGGFDGVRGRPWIRRHAGGSGAPEQPPSPRTRAEQRRRRAAWRGGGSRAAEAAVASRGGARWRLVGVLKQPGCGAGDGLRRGERGRRARDELGSAPESLRDARSGLERCRGYLTHAGLPVIPMPCRALACGRGRPRAAGVRAERIPPCAPFLPCVTPTRRC